MHFFTSCCLLFDPFFAFPTYFVWLFGLLRLISAAFLTLTSILFPLWELLWEFTVFRFFPEEFPKRRFSQCFRPSVLYPGIIVSRFFRSTVRYSRLFPGADMPGRKVNSPSVRTSP